MRLILRCLALLLALIAGPAFADMTATYVGANNTASMTIEIAANGDVRGSASNTPNSYFITRDGHGFMVQASFDGPVVMRMEDIGAVMAEQARRMFPNGLPPAGASSGGFNLKKGPIVTIHGRQGVPYYPGGRGAPTPHLPPMVVISDDPALAPLGRAMAGQFDMSMAVAGQMFGDANPFADLLAVLHTGAPLAITGMELDKVSDAPIPAARFVLLARPASLDVVRKTLGVAAPTR